MTGARVSSGSDSKQDYATPADFMAAVVARFRAIAFDLAADEANTKAAFYYCAPDTVFVPFPWRAFPKCVGVDALAHDWNETAAEFGGPLFLNPPFADIAPWARKCAASREAEILFLVPASVGSNWFRDHVFGRADVYFLNGRLCFDGKGLYPKDCILAHFRRDASRSIFIWSWRTDALQSHLGPRS